MTGAVLRAGAWPAVAGVSGVAVVGGGSAAAFPAAATTMLPVCFALLAAAAAFTLDEPASAVVDVTPTRPVRRTSIRAVALLAPLAVGALVMLALAMRGQVLPWAAASLALLAAAAAFTLDEPASLVVDVTPTGPVRRTGIRAVALLAPLAAGALVMLAAAMCGLALPWAAAGLALLGNVVLGFAVACVVRTRTGEPGVAAGTAVVLLLLAPGLVPQVARWVHTFPASGAGGPSADTMWWTVLAVCVAAIAISVGGRRLPRWMPRFSAIPALARIMVAVPPVAAGT